MENKHWFLAFVVVLFILQFTGKVNFLGATTVGWSDIGTNAADTLKSTINTILDWIKSNVILASAIILGLLLMFTSKKFKN